MENAFFLTSRSSNQMYFYSLNENNQYERHMYYPVLFEKMTGSQINKYQRKFIMRFFIWGLIHQKDIKNPVDKRIMLSRVFDFNGGMVLSIFMGITLNKVANNIKSPFLEMMLEDTKFPIKRFKFTICGMITVAMMYYTFQKFFNQTYLYDMALKYKENFAKDELFSPNCEHLFKKFILKNE